jgi:hypothetical protein
MPTKTHCIESEIDKPHGLLLEARQMIFREAATVKP